MKDKEIVEKGMELCERCGHHKGAHIFSSKNACLRCAWFGTICLKWTPSGKYTTFDELREI